MLHYEPEETQSIIRRTAPFTLDLSCHFNRFQYSYKMAFVPKSNVQNLFKRMRKREKFKLTPNNALWEPLSPSDTFTLGRPMFFEAHTELLSSGQRLYVHSCFATPEPSASSAPRFNVVSNYGCMVESKDGRSSFIPSASNAVRFSVDAFIFAGLEGNTLYMHCTMSVGPYAPTDTDKSCNYRPEIGRWVELNGSESVCSCCDSTCASPASPETVISSKAWNIDVNPTAAAKKKEKKKRSKIMGAKRKSKSPPRAFRPKHEDLGHKGESGESESVSKDVRWAVAEAEPLEVVGSAVVEVVEEIKEPEKGKRLVFEEIFGLNPYDPPHNKIKG
uniref:ZP domain-containing protein n=1 Tax=Neogobius melanostomus TaxID=47308 RepID=A0A8C6UIZ3_9GOBI